MITRSPNYTVGGKEDEAAFDDFETALEHLRQMGQVKWRRPNTGGNWGIVAAVRWAPLKK